MPADLRMGSSFLHRASGRRKNWQLAVLAPLSDAQAPARQVGQFETRREYGHGLVHGQRPIGATRALEHADLARQRQNDQQQAQHHAPQQKVEMIKASISCRSVVPESQLPQLQVQASR